MPTSLGDKDTNWSYRIFARRLVLVKDKNEHLRKIAVTDLSSNLPFVLETALDVSIESIEVEEEYSATFKVYTLRNVEGIKQKYVEFFEVLDVDQSVEDFIKIYWIYPDHTKFILVELEPP